MSVGPSAAASDTSGTDLAAQVAAAAPPPAPNPPPPAADLRSSGVGGNVNASS